MKNLLEEKLDLGPELIVDSGLAIKLATAWHEVFCPSLLKWVTEKPKSGFRWESVIFDSAGDEAKKQFALHKARSYFIMPEAFGYKNSVMYQTPVLPEYGDYLLDFYVFPKNMAWSMAFAHESGSQMLDLGPYFSKHPDYEKLQKNNVKSFNAKNRY